MLRGVVLVLCGRGVYQGPFTSIEEDERGPTGEEASGAEEGET